MAGRGISIDILANVRDALKGTGDLEKAISDIDSTLEDMAREGDDATDKMSRGFRDLAKDADKSADKIESSFKDTGKKVGKDLDDGFDKAKEGAQEFKDEAAGTARESAASFDGSAESIGDAFQEVAANALAGFGPLGAAAGVAIAAGFGVATAAFEKYQEAVEEAKEAAFTLASEMDVITGAWDVASGIKEWTSDTEKYAQAVDLAKITHMETSDVIYALAAGGGPLDELNKKFQDNALYTDVAAGRVAELGGALEGTEKGFKAGTDAAKANGRAMYNLAKDTGKATGEVDALGNKIVDLPDGKKVVINANTKTASEDLEEFSEDVAGLKDGSVKVTIKPDTKEWWAAMDRIKKYDPNKVINIGVKLNGTRQPV